METPKPIIEIIEIEKDNIKYALTLKNVSNKLEIVVEDNSLISAVFIKIYSKEELSNLSNFFNMFENINDIIPSIVDLIRNKQYTINISKNEFLLEIFTNIKNVKNIRFNLKENEIDTNLMIKKLIATIKRIENENINLKERLSKVEKKLEIKEEKKKKIELSFEGTTLISDDEKKLIYDWILENTEKKFNLLYKLTRDGDGCSTFHTKCDGKGLTIIIIQTTSGYKFGDTLLLIGIIQLIIIKRMN